MFNKTKDILEATESALLRFSTNRSLLQPVQRLLIYPLVYLKVGFGDFSKPFAIWSFVSFLVVVVLGLLSSSLELSRETLLLSVNLCMWGALLLTTFLTPSTYAFCGATDVSVNRVVEILDKNGVKSEADVELLECNIEKIEERINSRVKFYKWIIGAFWGLYLLSMNFQLRLLSLSGNTIDNEFLNSSFEGFLYVILFTAFGLLAMISYKRASDMLIANLKYACVEQKSRNKTA